MLDRDAPSLLDGELGAPVPIRWRLLAFLALRSLTQHPLTLFLLVAAVTAGVGFQIPNVSHMLGFEAELMEEGVDHGKGDVRVKPPPGKVFDEPDTLTAELLAHPDVFAVTPVVMVPGAVGVNSKLVGAPVVGIDATAKARPYVFLRGKELEHGKPGLLLGNYVAKTLDVDVGDRVDIRVLLLSPRKLRQLQAQKKLEASPIYADLRTEAEQDRDATRELQEQLKHDKMRVRGIVGGPWGAFDTVYLDRSYLNRQIGTPGDASSIYVYLHDHSAAKQVSKDILAAHPELQAPTWLEDSTYLRSTVGSVSALAAVTHAMVVFAVAIPVLALLFVNVLYRRKEVAMLCALGLRRSEVFWVFLLQALLVGLVGVVLGCLGGFAAILYFTNNPIYEYEGFVLAPIMTVESFVMPSLVVLTATVLAGLYPAWRASGVDPASTLRGAS